MINQTHPRYFTLMSALVAFTMIPSVWAQPAKILFQLPNQTPVVSITPAQEEVPMTGPTDFTVIGDVFAVLDSNRHRIVFLNKEGQFLKHLALPKGYYQRLVRLRDDTLVAFAELDSGQSKMVHTNLDEVLEEQLIDATLANFSSHLLVDDRGLFMEIHGELDKNQRFSLLHHDKASILDLSQTLLKQRRTLRIKQECFNCKPVPAHGTIIHGLSYRIDFAKPFGNEPKLYIGNHPIPLDNVHQHGHTGLEQVDADGTAWVYESIFFNEKEPDTYLWKIDVSGKRLAAFHGPKTDSEEYVEHSVAIGHDGRVYWMGGGQTGLSIQELKPLSAAQYQELLDQMNSNTGRPIKPQLMQWVAPKIPPEQTVIDQCTSRTDMFVNAIKYLYAYVCLADAAISNDKSCPKRTIPGYLSDSQGGCYWSISYNWGGFDSVDAFIEKTSTMKAGNTNTASAPMLHCAAGVDCSGFISRVWDLSTKYNTNTIYQQTTAIPVQDMNTGDVFVKPGSHVMMFSGWDNDDIVTLEAVVRPGKVVVSRHHLEWFSQQHYSSRLAFNACPEE
jgi:hypothetical protein